MTKMTDYDLRQLNLMVKMLDAYEQGTINLRRLISNLEGLQSALRDVDYRWKNEFLKEWGVLEDVYADTLDKNLKIIPNEFMDLIREAIQEIRKLISVHV